MSTGGAWAYGAINEITMTNHGLTCVPVGGDPGSGQTARVFFGVKGYYVEAGWQEWRCSSGGYSGNCFRAFQEWSLGTGGQWRSSTTAYPCLYPGSRAYWRIETQPLNQYNFDGYVNCEDGAGRRYLTTQSLYPYSAGYAEGEGFHRDSSSMGEAHTALQWKDSGGGWHYASGVFCRLDTDHTYGWNGKYISNTEFDVVQWDGYDCGG